MRTSGVVAQAVMRTSGAVEHAVMHTSGVIAKTVMRTGGVIAHAVVVEYAGVAHGPARTLQRGQQLDRVAEHARKVHRVRRVTNCVQQHMQVEPVSKSAVCNILRLKTLKTNFLKFIDPEGVVII